MEQKEMIAQIARLKTERKAVILAHNYQVPAVQDVADHVGDSLELSRLAAATDAEVIVFCGVKFMAETAKILSPSRTVLLPEAEAGCPMADMITPERLAKARAEHPGAAVVAYVNTNIEIKAMSDICCTSGNALKVVESLKQHEIIFIPDKNLGRWVQRFTKKKIHFNYGFCIVHENLRPEDAAAMRKRYPSAKLIAHPECPPAVLDLADAVESTSGMLRYVERSRDREFIVATEEGINHRLAKLFPDRVIHAMEPRMVCRNMKKTSLESVYLSLRVGQYEIKPDPSLMDRARRPLELMIGLG
jgi:quinolinate synthase